MNDGDLIDFEKIAQRNGHFMVGTCGPGMGFYAKHNRNNFETGRHGVDRLKDPSDAFDCNRFTVIFCLG